ncbi:MAG: hypothetical protein U5K73_08960 [Halofilum sp. (in: g-proteobacteria)]|nr:hypothetical protein [Halofilum sp. (in: g-proteobacteria)]
MARDDGYEDSDATPPPRLLLHMGQNVPADIARELDVKLDDGAPGHRHVCAMRSTAGSDREPLHPSATGSVDR